MWALTEYKKTRKEHYRVVALDGCFFESPNQGEILTAIGRCGNNHIYLTSWAVVNVENKDSWSWFLELLGADLDMPTGQDRGCEAIENGFSECFNSAWNIFATWSDDICRSILKRIDLMKNHTRLWHVIHIGGDSFEVRSGSDALKPDQSQFSKVLPPKPRIMSGRPKKKMIRASHEGRSRTRVSWLSNMSANVNMGYDNVFMGLTNVFVGSASGVGGSVQGLVVLVFQQDQPVYLVITDQGNKRLEGDLLGGLGMMIVVFQSMSTFTMTANVLASYSRSSRGIRHCRGSVLSWWCIVVVELMLSVRDGFRDSNKWRVGFKGVGERVLDR
nr:multidrug resistance-associated protein 5 [Tanacetum cinerariifolium]